MGLFGAVMLRWAISALNHHTDAPSLEFSVGSKPNVSHWTASTALSHKMAHECRKKEGFHRSWVQADARVSVGDPREAYIWNILLSHPHLDVMQKTSPSRCLLPNQTSAEMAEAKLNHSGTLFQPQGTRVLQARNSLAALSLKLLCFSLRDIAASPANTMTRYTHG